MGEGTWRSLGEKIEKNVNLKPCNLAYIWRERLYIFPILHYLLHILPILFLLFLASFPFFGQRLKVIALVIQHYNVVGVAVSTPLVQNSPALVLAPCASLYPRIARPRPSPAPSDDLHTLKGYWLLTFSYPVYTTRHSRDIRYISSSSILTSRLPRKSVQLCQSISLTFLFRSPGTIRCKL